MAGARRRLILGGMAVLAACSRPDVRRAAAGPARIARLIARYPDHLADTDGDMLIWTDGARMPIGAREPARPFDEMLRAASIADQLRQDYEPGPLRAPPPRDHSPGRLRNAAFFLRMYGDCRGGAAALRLRSVTWMPWTAPQALPVTAVNDVATRLERVIDALEAMPDRIKAYLVPSAGTYACRGVADTGLLSMHAHGAALDIAIRHSDYWAWARPRGEILHRNRVPPEIVEAFEAERFIWGGKWYHYDTMHFEYRPELFA
jgi:hypothetical protein